MFKDFKSKFAVLCEEETSRMNSDLPLKAKPMKATTSQRIKVRSSSIVCNDHPEWGSFGVWEDQGGSFVIGNSRGSRMLDKWEADNFWSIVTK